MAHGLLAIATRKTTHVIVVLQKVQISLTSVDGLLTAVARFREHFVVAIVTVVLAAILIDLNHLKAFIITVIFSYYLFRFGSEIFQMLENIGTVLFF